MKTGATRKILKILAKEMPGLGLRISLFRAMGIEIGKDVYIAEGVMIAEELERPERIVIGDRVSIAPGVILVTTSHPNNSVLREKYGERSGEIIIEEDAWLGAGAIILPGIKIGKRAIIGAGAVVTKDVKDDTTVVGVPASEIRNKEAG